MNLQARPYDPNHDYLRVYSFLTDTFQSHGCYMNWPPPRWEYMHFHPNLNIEQLHRIGIWEEGNRIVGVANYEDDLQDVYFQIHPFYPFLVPEMVDYAEKHLFSHQEHKKGFIRIFANDFDSILPKILQDRGYNQVDSHTEYYGISELLLEGSFPKISLPSGFRLKSLVDDNHLTKIGHCLWKGFNHPGDLPEEDTKDRILMQSAPHFRKDLNIVVEAENGDFVSYSGVWLVPECQSAYIEPVATVPEYRRRGLGEAAVMECVKRCGEMGIKRVIVESALPFYLKIGFKPVFYRFPWMKQL